MSLGLKEVEAPPSRQSEVPLEDIALQFFNLMYEKKHPIEMTRSPETQPKLQKVLSDGLAPAAAAPGAQATHPQAGQGNDDRARARHIARHLIDMGDDLERRLKLSEAIREEFQKQFQLQSVFHMAYDGFSKTCLGVLANASDRIHSGWDQLYVLNYSYYLVGEELTRQAGQRDSQGRITQMRHHVVDVAHEIGLDDWIQTQGGTENMTREVRGMKCVEVTVPELEEGTSVDK